MYFLDHRSKDIDTLYTGEDKPTLHSYNKMFTPRRACAARGKVIALGIYICLAMSTNKIRSPFQHRKASL